MTLRSRLLGPGPGLSGALPALLVLAGACAGPGTGPADLVVEVGPAPQGIRFGDGGRYAWVCLSGSDEVCVIDCRRMEVVARFPGGSVPHDLVPVARDESWLVSELEAAELLRLSDDGLYSDGVDVGGGPGLFADPTPDGLTAVSCRFDDEVFVLEGLDGEVVQSFRTGAGPGTPTLSRDGVLCFVPNGEAGTVTVIDLLNEETLATVAVGARPAGGFLTADGVSYVVACTGSNELVWVNTASFQVTDRVREGVGLGPSSAVLGPDGRTAYVTASGGEELTVLDVQEKRVVGSLPVGRHPSVVRLHPDRRRLFVSNESHGTVSVVGLGPSLTGSSGGGSGESEVLVIGTIHGDHRTSARYGLDFLDALVRAYDPDVVLVEIPPNRMERAEAQFASRGVIEEERVVPFPEYTDVLFPLRQELGFEIVPTAGWSASISKYRRASLDRLSADPTRVDDWRRYREATERSRQAVAQGGVPDDPFWIHTAAYDEAAEIQLRVYSELFSEDLGPGSWEAINEAHYANIARYLDANAGRGLRVLVTYGTYHKGWLQRRLKRRDDVELVDPVPWLEAARAAVGG